jgi:hypothetical protein
MGTFLGQDPKAILADTEAMKVKVTAAKAINFIRNR